MCSLHPLREKKNVKNLEIEGGNWEEDGKNWVKEKKLGRKGKNQEGSFTLPLLIDMAGYATVRVRFIALLSLLYMCIVSTNITPGTSPN